MNRQADRWGFGPALVVTVTLAFASVLLLTALELLVIHSHVLGTGPSQINQQNQTVKTELYVVAFLVILPLGLFVGPRLVDAIGAGPNGAALPAFAAALVGALAAALLVIRLSGGLPWGDGVKGILGAMIVWWLLAAGATWCVLRGGRSQALARAQRTWPAPAVIAAALIFGTLVSVTSAASLGATPLVLGVLISAGVLAAYARVRLPGQDASGGCSISS